MRRYKIEELKLEIDSKYTVFGGIQTYDIRYKGKLLFQSASKDEVENWLRTNAIVPNKVVDMPKTISEAVARAFINNRRS